MRSLRLNNLLRLVSHGILVTGSWPMNSNYDQCQICLAGQPPAHLSSFNMICYKWSGKVMDAPHVLNKHCPGGTVYHNPVMRSTRCYQGPRPKATGPPRSNQGLWWRFMPRAFHQLSAGHQQGRHGAQKPCGVPQKWRVSSSFPIS